MSPSEIKAKKVGNSGKKGTTKTTAYVVVGESKGGWIIHKEGASAKPGTASSAAVVAAVENGLSVESLDHLRERLNVPMERLCFWLSIPKATYQRRKRSGRLTVDESDRLLRFARLVKIATEVLDSEENARAWLGHPQFGLGDRIPLEFARTEAGAREVEDLLTRIEHSVYA